MTDAVKEIPILFSGPMVRAILEGRKTQTRRMMKPQPILDDGIKHPKNGFYHGPRFWQWKDCQWADGGLGFPESGIKDYSPFGVSGDRLWVRETWVKEGDYHSRYPERHEEYFLYRATIPFGLPDHMKWRPSIHMPRCASRITLEVVGVRAERLQDISDEDAKAEGVVTDGEYSDRSSEGEENIVPCLNCRGTGLFTAFTGGGAHPDQDCPYCDTMVKRFALLWDSLAKSGKKWSDNPWVWVIEFRRVENV